MNISPPLYQYITTTLSYTAADGSAVNMAGSTACQNDFVAMFTIGHPLLALDPPQNFPSGMFPTCTFKHRESKVMIRTVNEKMNKALSDFAETIQENRNDADVVPAT